MNWLDPEPDPEPSKDSDDLSLVHLIGQIQCKQRTDFYKGYYQPPTEEEYRRLCLRERED